MITLLEHFVVAFVFLVLLGVYLKAGTRELLRVVVIATKQIPGVSGLVASTLKSEAASFIKTTKLASNNGAVSKVAMVTLPKSGVSREELLNQMTEMKEKETDHMDGKVFAYAYTLTDDHYELQKDVYEMFSEKIGHSPEHDSLVKTFQRSFMHENALNPMVYPSLRRMETEVVSMTSAMLHGDASCAGFLTSGGTESLLMAVKTYRDRAQKLAPWITKPEIVVPITHHPALDKAAHYFGLKVIHVPVTSDLLADVDAMGKAITSNTVLVSCSAPQFCHGLVDPVMKVSNMAAKHGLPCHVDACFGGFMLPWVEKLGYDVPPWDFRCPGVTSISADVHKYGYSVKGASVIVYKSEDYRKYQIYSYGSWPGGLYGSPSMAGTRPGGNIAAAWAAMKSLGEEGYMARAKTLMDITDRLKQGVASIQELKIMGRPQMTCVAVGSNDPNISILAVADLMEKKGWTMERQQNPDCVHCSVLPHHQVSCDQLVQDFRDSVQEAKKNPQLSKQGTAGIYGMMAAIPDTVIIEDFIKEFFSEVYKLQ